MKTQFLVANYRRANCKILEAAILNASNATESRGDLNAVLNATSEKMKMNGTSPSFNLALIAMSDDWPRFFKAFFVVYAY